MAYLVAVLVGLVFGAADQYLGTLRFGPWAWTVSGMSAPWLVLPFLVGVTQVRPRRAAALGLVATLAALLGYFAMTHSPMEGAPIADFPRRFWLMVSSGYNLLWILGGIVTGPLYGLLGQRWRVARSRLSAVLVAGALSFEPLVRLVVGRLSSQALVWCIEVAVGAAAAAYFVVFIARRRRQTDPEPSPG